MSVRAVAIITGSLLAICGSAAADPCTNGPEPVIAITPGADGCFNYSGTAIYFAGSFSTGQSVDVRMTGEAADQDSSGKVTTYTSDRNANAEGPADFYVESTADDGSLSFRVPRDGTYKFSYGPRAMLCAPGKVTICAK
jgi:hypothetical protein